MDKLSPLTLPPHDMTNLLASTHWARQFSATELQTLGHYFFAFEVAPEQIIFSEGVQSDYMGLIIKGSIKIQKEVETQVYKTIATITDSHTFGELALIDDAPRSASAKSITDTLFVITTRRHLLTMADTHPNLAFKLLWEITQIVTNRLRNSNDRLLDTQRLALS